MTKLEWYWISNVMVASANPNDRDKMDNDKNDNDIMDTDTNDNDTRAKD